MRSDARKRTHHHPDCPVVFFTDHPERCRCSFMVALDARQAKRAATDRTLAPIVALAEAADRQFGSAQNISRDALWAAIRAARGDQA